MKNILPKSRYLKASLFILPFLVVTAVYLLFATRFDKKDCIFSDNLLYVDRSGAAMRFVPDARGERHIWLAGNKIPQIVKDAFIAAEDQKFYLHPGFDLAAIVRAAKDNLLAGKTVSGASTISQQTVRLIYPRKRTYRNKIIEILRAMRMELALSKAEILEQYLNRVPMGNNIVGIELASRTFFGKSAAELSAAEAALLASIPKAPGRINPYAGNHDRLFARKDWVLANMAEARYLTQGELSLAKSEKFIFHEPYFPNEAPHFIDSLNKQGMAVNGRVRTTIDMEIQRAAEQILSSHSARLAYLGANQAAVMVIHNPAMEALASAGSISYGEENKGFNDGTNALRSAGSTLKPFIYAQALDDGFSAAWSLEDTQKMYKTPKGDYKPANFDKKTYGPVTMRSALGNSLNISTIRMLQSVGQDRYFDLLSELGLINDPTKTSAHYGLGLVIGNPEVTLAELVRAYAMLANGGELRSIRHTIGKGHGEDASSRHRVFSQEAAYIISDILSDPSARFITFDKAGSMRFPFKISVKTGTSTKYRDAWAVGYTPEYTVGVWAGNFEGNPTFSMSGAKGAAPILNDIFRFLYKDKTPSLTEAPEGVVSAKVCGISGMKPGRFCKNVTTELFIKGNTPNETCTFHTNEERFHELPATYAAWVYDKKKAGTAGNYRIKGLSEKLDEMTTREIAEERGYTVDKKGHYSIKGRDARPEINNTAIDYLVSITYPLHNDNFILEKGRSDQTIRLEAVTEKPVKYMQWFIDGKFYKKAAPAYYVYWKPERGWHTISISTPDNIGDSIRIKVE